MKCCLKNKKTAESDFLGLLYKEMVKRDIIRKSSPAESGHQICLGKAYDQIIAEGPVEK